MELTRDYICGSDKIFFLKGYIAMDVPDLDVPDKLTVRGVDLVKKPKLHVSLVCVKEYSGGAPETEDKVIQLFCQYLKSNPVDFDRYSGEFRFAEDDEKKTLVAMCIINGLGPFFDLVKRELGIDMSEQPTHVTLYTLQPNVGVGLFSKQMVQDLSVDVTHELNSEFVDKFRK